MRATVLPEPYDDFTTKGAKVGGCLWDACEVATAAERRVLARVGALLQIGVWHATALDLMPHPKLAGLCLVQARDSPRGYPWSYLLDADTWHQKECIQARKVLYMHTRLASISTRESTAGVSLVPFVSCRGTKTVAAAAPRAHVQNVRRSRRCTIECPVLAACTVDMAFSHDCELTADDCD